MAPSISPPPDLQPFEFLHDWWAVIAGIVAAIWYSGKALWNISRTLTNIFNDIQFLKREVVKLQRADEEIIHSLEAGEYCRVPCPREDCQ